MNPAAQSADEGWLSNQILVCQPLHLWGGDYKATDTINSNDGQNYAQRFLLSPMTHTNLARPDNEGDLQPRQEQRGEAFTGAGSQASRWPAAG